MGTMKLFKISILKTMLSHLDATLVPMEEVVVEGGDHGNQLGVLHTTRRGKHGTHVAWECCIDETAQKIWRHMVVGCPS